MSLKTLKNLITTMLENSDISIKLTHAMATELLRDIDQLQNIKPDWKDAPEWANYVAMDDNSRWWWYEKEPFWRCGEWDEYTGKVEPCGAKLDGSITLEERPDEI